MSQEKLKLDNKQKSLHKIITNNTLGIPVHLVVGSVDFFNKIQRKYNINENHNPKEYTAAETAVAYFSEGVEIFIWLREFNGYVDEYRYLVHEAVHAVNAIFEFIGHKPDLLNDEVQASLTDSLFDKMLKILIKEYKQRED